jgi:sodium-dependent dicarboxylate transporter 2/3/5
MKLKRNTISLLLGPVAFGAMQVLGGPDTMNDQAFQVLCVTAWVAIWWITEAVPIAITALLPIILFPLTGALSISDTTAAFGHKYIFLYLGGFLLAIAIEKWNLHKRIAISIIHLIGSNINTIILGFMAATGFMSMWISNTATSVMMLPIGMAVISQFKKDDSGETSDAQFVGKALMLAIAYSASIGGFATLIGTPPNLVLTGVLEETYGVKISFFDWMKIGLPISILLMFGCWIYLTRFAFRFEQKEFPGGRTEIKNMLLRLGKMSYEETVVMWVFALTATLWISRSFIEKYIPAIDDTIIAMVGGTLLFIIPAGDKKPIIEWKECSNIPWGIILLFGGGMALAKGFSDTGLAEWIALQLGQMNGLSLFLLILLLVAAINFLTEITSNLATTAMLLPVLAPMAMAFDLHPYMIMVSVTIAASCAFMLPVATPPNAVVFGSGHLRIPDMMRAGIWMNLISIVLVTLFTYYFLPILWNIEPNVFPASFNMVTK